jgi:hypothetical protein
VALDFSTKEKAAAKGLALIKYDIGARLSDVVESEDVYGSDAVRQLSIFLGASESDLYACLNVARKFTREQVEQAASRPMSDGRHLSFHHLMHLASIQSEGERQRLTEVAQIEGWSTRQLAREIEAAGLGKTKSSNGGRKPARPRSFLAAVQQMTQNMQGFNHKTGNWTDVFDAVDEIAADNVDVMWVAKIEQALNEVIRLRDQLPEIRAKLLESLVWAEQALASREPEDSGSCQRVNAEEIAMTGELADADG